METKELNFYFEMHGDEIVEYGFGGERIPARMFFGDYGFKTAEEAFKDYKNKHPEFDREFKDYWKGEVI